MIEAGKAAIEVDVCVGCQMLWLDAGEQEKLGVKPDGVVKTASPEPGAAQLAAAGLMAESRMVSDASGYRREKKAKQVRWLGALVEVLLWWAT